ncbi:MAG: flagellar basal body L-ring protein FlgH [Thermodesulforhabdaceae bacterium]
MKTMFPENPRKLPIQRNGGTGLSLGVALACLFIALASGCATLDKHADVPDQAQLTPPPQLSPPSPPATTPTLPNPPSASIQQQPMPQPSGSIWTNQSGSLYQDIKARNVGDIVTITVSESADASEEATTETKRSHDWGGSISASNPAVAGKNLLGGATALDYSAQFGRGNKGSGKTTRTNTVKAYMTATVVDVLPNGNLVIRGSRWVKVNDELHQIVLEGVIRPVDISRNNTVMSQNIADAKIFIVGKGPVSRQQRPGWLGQIIDLLFPF